MPTAFTHAVPALALGTVFLPPQTPRMVFLTGVALAVLPDLDILGIGLNINGDRIFSHRGFSHSLFFALAVSLLAYAFIRRIFPETRSPKVWLYLFLSAASHGALDALTNGGWGVAFFAPWDGSRYFFPFQPILVSPLSLEGILSDYGKSVLWNEFQWVWVPSMFLSMIGYFRQFRILNGPAKRGFAPHGRSNLSITPS